MDVLIKDYPTHAALLPIALTVSCSATRHVQFEYPLSAKLLSSSICSVPKFTNTLVENNSIGLHTNSNSRHDLHELKAGDCVFLSGKIYTARDAAHQRLQQLYENGDNLPEGIDFNNALIYYVGPVAAVNDEVIGPAGPTTAKRMDKYSRFMLEDLNISGMIGKGERDNSTVALIKKHAAVYFAAVGGAACLISKSITAARIVAFADLGMEAIYELEVENMPLIVAVDSKGNSIYKYTK